MSKLTKEQNKLDKQALTALGWQIAMTASVGGMNKPDKLRLLADSLDTAAQRCRDRASALEEG